MELFSISWSTIIGIFGGIIFIFLLNRLKKEVQKEKDRLSEGKTRKEGTKVLNKIKKGGTSASDILKALKKERAKRSKKKK